MFPEKVFRFSPDLQISVRKEKKALPGFSNRSKSYLTPLNVPRNQRAPRRNAVILCLRRLAEEKSDYQPDREEVHFPFYWKYAVCSLYVSEFKKP